MEISEFKAERRKLELELTEIIAQKVSEFETATGYSPSSIDIEMINATTIGDDKPRYVVARVRVAVEI